MNSCKPAVAGRLDLRLTVSVVCGAESFRSSFLGPLTFCYLGVDLLALVELDRAVMIVL